MDFRMRETVDSSSSGSSSSGQNESAIEQKGQEKGDRDRVVAFRAVQLKPRSLLLLSGDARRRYGRGEVDPSLAGKTSIES
eukprot:scaffold685_cov281-Pinguiococcus_pyrenoidosus.AAC.19